MKNDLDKIIAQALTPSDEPDFWLNQKILNQKKEQREMIKKNKRRIPAAVLTAVAVLGISTVTAYAALNYLTPDNVAEKMHQTKLEDAFSGEDAILVNETQSFGGYNVTFLGVVSGENLTEVSKDGNTSFGIDKTYAVVAIENFDGTPMPDTSEDAYNELEFFVSPLIAGYNPFEYNAATMHGGYQEMSEDGILYRIAECDSVEMFADHELYLCVVDRMFLNAGPYEFDEVTGEISRNESYEGLNALFDLPLDESKANPDEAKAYMDSLFGEDEAESSNENTAAGETENIAGNDLDVPAEVKNLVDNLTSENVEEYGSLVKSIVCTPDREGYITCDWELEGRGGGSETTLVSALFSDSQAGTSEHMFFAGMSDISELYWKTYTLNADGTVTVNFYVPK